MNIHNIIWVALVLIQVGIQIIFFFCSSWISGRERMTIENISWSYNKRMLPYPQPPANQLKEHVAPDWGWRLHVHPADQRVCCLPEDALDPWLPQSARQRLMRHMPSCSIHFHTVTLSLIVFCVISKQGPIVQSVVCLTSSLRVILLTVLADSIYNILIFFAEKMWVAFALQISAYKFCDPHNVNFNESLTNDIVSFEQLGPES